MALISVTNAIRFNMEYKTPFCFLEDRPPDSVILIMKYRIFTFPMSSRGISLKCTVRPNLIFIEEYPDNVILVKIEDPFNEAHMFSVKSYMGVINFPAESGILFA